MPGLKFKLKSKLWPIPSGRGLQVFSTVVMALFIVLIVARRTAPRLLAGVSFSKQVHAFDGKELRMTLSRDEKYRVFTHLRDIDENFKQAVLLHEDRHFYYHFGFNPWTLAKAALTTYVQGGRRIGGSTITMQLARMTSTVNSKSLHGKILQILQAIWLETLYSKEEIFEAYLNLLPYGGNVEGVGAASEIYFQKPATQLNLAEALTLVVIPQSPSARGLLDESHELDSRVSPKLARERLFRQWVQIHPAEQSAKIELALPLGARLRSQLPFLAPHFVDHILRMGVDQGEVHTTLRRSMQRILEERVSTFVKSHTDRGVYNASALLVNHETMQVEALVGSADYWNTAIDGQVSGVFAKRSPGSTLKPFVYALALDQGLIHPLTLLKDTPMSFSGFDPENFDRDFAGPLSATEALVRSRNVPAVYLSSLLKNPTLYEFLKETGITRLRESGFYGLALPLGGAEITMEELVQLYAMLANHGELRPLQYVVNGPSKQTIKHVLSPEVSFMALDMLRQNPRPEQHFRDEWVRGRIPVAWKTGTSHGFRDAWAVGIAGPYVLAIWLGNFDGEGNAAFVGRDLAGPLFFSVLDALKDKWMGHDAWLSTEALNVKRVEVCALSGHLPGKACPHHQQTWFIPGKSPISTCQIHREIAILPHSGLRACNETEPGLKKSVYEFWPSDLLQVFRIAGMPRKPPPAYDPSCTINDTANLGNPPQIISPKLDVTYSYHASHASSREALEIPFQAVCDGDVNHLFWFVGSELIGDSDVIHPLLWKPRSGHFKVRVVDNLGREASRDLNVKAVE